jgi:hypothetical protein
MTTIVATRQAIYADTLCSYTVPFKVNKIMRIGNSLFAGAGDLDDIQKFFSWRRDGGEAPVFEDSLDVLEVCTEGIFLWGKKFVRLLIDEDTYVIGSGSHYAMGALAMGATPKQAIGIAAKFDSQTGYPINSVKLKGRQCQPSP